MSYVIEEGIQLPIRVGRPPSAERTAMVALEVGQSFLIDDFERVHIARCAASRLGAKKFRVLKVREGWRVWRVE